MVKQTLITKRTPGRGMHAISDDIAQAVEELAQGASGLVNLFLQHTSASLLIQENADPSARRDLEEFFDRLAPEGQPWHRHLDEGPDDTVSHMKAAILPTTLTLPVTNGKLALGTWQGLYLTEHRRSPHTRKILITFLS